MRTNQIYDKKRHVEVTHEYIYESGGKVFWWNKTTKEFTILYDFRAEVGDEWTIQVGNETIIVHVDNIDDNYTYNNLNFKALHITDKDDLFSGTILCGIGHLTSFFPEKLMTPNKGFQVKGMRCYWKNGLLVFQHGNMVCDDVYEQLHYDVDDIHVVDAFRVYPNPTDGRLFIDAPDGETYRITNVMGPTLMSGTVTSEGIHVASLPPGIYFISISQYTTKFIVNQ